MTSAAYHDGQYRCVRLVNGRYRLLLDCTHATPRAAIRHSGANLDPFVSPLRASDEATTPVPVPPSGAGRSVASSESPSGGSRLRGQAGE